MSLGCFRNTYDSKSISQEFLDKGYRALEDPCGAETLIINTCGFIDAAKLESIQAIKDAVTLKRKKKIKKIIVTGCLSQRYLKELTKFFPAVDQWRGVLPVKDATASDTRAQASEFIKVCDGCVHTCSFCAIPLIKGKLKSRSLASIVAEAKFLESRGVKELNIIGQDTSSWGLDTKEGRLSELLAQILAKTRIPWIRLLYLHPRHIDERLLSVMASSPRVCQYIDLPIQHIHDRILKLMNRRITGKEIHTLIDKIRSRMPEAVLRTSVIVGFPTETQKEFNALIRFLKVARFERLGAFTYSREENTPAYGLTGQVHEQTKKRRLRELMQMQKEIAQQAHARFVGRPLQVLIEERDSDVAIGRSQYDAPEVDGVVYVKSPRPRIGVFYKAHITDSYEYDLVGH